jgi:hypothetical protein
MKITSKYKKGVVFWRTFNKEDAMYVAGLMEGHISYGESFEYDHPAGYFKIEMKSNGIFGGIIVAAGRTYSNSDEFILTSEGKLELVTN